MGAISPLYKSPSSPAANERLEQNPSDDDMINVRPSLDLRWICMLIMFHRLVASV